MMKSPLVFIISLMMTLTLRCPISSAEQINLKPKTCIDRADEEKFVICFEQNLICHDALRKMSAEPKENWEVITMAILGGLLSGVLIESRTKH